MPRDRGVFMRSAAGSDRLGTEKIGKLLSGLAIPAIAGLLVNSLYNIVDTIYVGQGVGVLAIGGLAIAFPIQMFILGLSQLAGIGAASSVSRRLGAGETEQAERIAGNGLFLAGVMSLAFAAAGLLFMEPLLLLFGATDNLMGYASEYTRIILLGAVFNAVSLAAANLLQAEGRAKSAMFSTVIGAVLNIGLDPLFIFVFGMGVAGAAWATIISQMVSFIYVTILLVRSRKGLKISLHHLIPDIAIIRDILAVGFSAFLRSITSTVFSIVVNNSLRNYGGDSAITIFGIVNRVVGFLFLPALGVGQGLQPVAGYNYGAGRRGRVRSAVLLSIVAATTITSIGWLAAQLAPQIIIRAFTSDADIIREGSRVLRIVFLLAPLIGVQMVAGSLFQSLGKAVPALVVSMLRQFIILTPLILILPLLAGLGLEGVWLAFPFADGIAAIIVVVLLAQELRRLGR